MQTQPLTSILVTTGLDINPVFSSINSSFSPTVAPRVSPDGKLSRKDYITLSKEEKEVLNKLVRAEEKLATKAITPIIRSLISSKQGEDIVLKYPELYLRNRTIALLGQLIAETCGNGWDIHIFTQSDTLINALCVAVRMKIILPIQLRVTHISEDKEYNLKVDASGRFNKYPEGFLDEWDLALECLLTSPNEELPYERLRKNPSLSTSYV